MEQYVVSGMSCAACSARVEHAVGKVPGVVNCSVNLLMGSMSVEGTAESDMVIAAVIAAGYGARLKTADDIPERNPAYKLERELKRRLIISLIFMVPLFYVCMGHMFGWPLPQTLTAEENMLWFGLLQLVLCLPVAIVNHRYYTNGIKTLVHCAPNMDSLIAIGSGAAIIYGIYALIGMGKALSVQDMELAHKFAMNLYFESGAMILCFVTLGKYLEALGKGKTSSAIARLLDLAPKTAVVERNGEEIALPLAKVMQGDIVIVRSGEAVPVDGEIVWGSGVIDESALTGESMPVDKTVGDAVTGATINTAGYFKFRATAVGEETTLSRIVSLVEEAASSKAPIARLADKVSRVFVPVVIGIAILSFIIWLLVGAGLEFSLSMGIAVLVISCPCALGLATPTAIMVGTGKGAENGILLKHAEALQAMSGVSVVVLDKTGTVTYGHPEVTDVLPYNTTATELLFLAGSLEKTSSHPLARAIIAECDQRGIELNAACDYENLPGLGISANLCGVKILGGNAALMVEHGIELPDLSSLSFAGKTVLYFAVAGEYRGAVAVADAIKPDSAAAVAELRRQGVDVWMLTGDNEITARAVADKVGIENICAGLRPEQKAELVEELKHQYAVAFVGDGINDAPALATANVGVAIGAGTDIAIEAADIVLMKSSLVDVVTAINLSKKVMRNIKQNLFWALIYNCIGIPLASGVFYSVLGWQLNPMFAAAAMSMSSVCMVSNALRLRGFKPSLVCDKEKSYTDDKTITDNIDFEGGYFPMKKQMMIEGMSCPHCSGRVEKVLNAIEGVSATVDLAAKTAHIELTADVADEVLKSVVEAEDFVVTAISNI